MRITFPPQFYIRCYLSSILFERSSITIPLRKIQHSNVHQHFLPIMDADRLSSQNGTASSAQTLPSWKGADGCPCLGPLAARSQSRLRESLLLVKDSIITLMFAPISIPMAVLVDAIRIVHALWPMGDNHVAPVSQTPVSSRLQEPCVCPKPNTCSSSGQYGRSEQPVGTTKAGDGVTRLPRELEALELYEAIFVPGDETEFIGVLYDKATKQWRSTSMAHESPQLARLRAREERVLVVCSRSLVQALSLGGCGKSMLTVNDQKRGLVLQHQTLVNRLPSGYEVLGFQAGELSGLRLSSHDVFHIQNLEDFLFHAARDAEAITAASGGAFLKSWLIPLPRLLGLMDDTAAQSTCKRGFWQLHHLGFATQVYLQLWDPGQWSPSDSLDDVEISDATTWFETYGQEMDSAMREAILNVLTFLLEPPPPPLPLPPAAAGTGSRSGPKIYIVSRSSMTASTSLMKIRDSTRRRAPPGPIDPLLLGKASRHVLPLPPLHHVQNEPASDAPQQHARIQHPYPLVPPPPSAAKPKLGIPSSTSQEDEKEARMGLHSNKSLCNGENGVSHPPSSNLRNIMKSGEEPVGFEHASCAGNITDPCIVRPNGTSYALSDRSGVSTTTPSVPNSIQEPSSPSAVISSAAPSVVDSGVCVELPTHNSGLQPQQSTSPDLPGNILPPSVRPAFEMATKDDLRSSPATTQPPIDPAASHDDLSPSRSASLDRSRNTLENGISWSTLPTDLSSPVIARVKPSTLFGSTHRRARRTTTTSPSPVSPPRVLNLPRAPVRLSDLTVSTRPCSDSSVWATWGVDISSDRATNGSSPSPLSLQGPTCNLVPEPGPQGIEANTKHPVEDLQKVVLRESKSDSLVKPIE
ncbi:hypothetical protein M406DRAFT_75060 [Cryphonectria parasitica EP155]|uniref:Uncharacterized protein n=1 Tax=Cryphonectria parasitica (strain ATCC 38755 / EP155) TaxID=660469 RepID=A0A9P4XZV8_CRYP1|nr:uncharacterized protein M406DRAFT_75060 [Cryphonectria parasitica EP155]KAF3763825.1 hypothetical protein M406DRAFT_75060 [Cryphonectria parasitica EP155]